MFVTLYLDQHEYDYVVSLHSTGNRPRPPTSAYCGNTCSRTAHRPRKLGATSSTRARAKRRTSTKSSSTVRRRDTFR